MHSSLQNIGLEFGLVQMPLVPIKTDIPRAAPAVANLNEWHHHLITQARDPGVISHFSFSLTHSTLVMKSVLPLPGPLPTQSFLYETLSLPWLGPSSCLPWITVLISYLQSCTSQPIIHSAAR